jgi:hypothetical protein
VLRATNWQRHHATSCRVFTMQGSQTGWAKLPHHHHCKHMLVLGQRHACGRLYTTHSNHSAKGCAKAFSICRTQACSVVHA